MSALYIQHCAKALGHHPFLYILIGKQQSDLVSSQYLLPSVYLWLFP